MPFSSAKQEVFLMINSPALWKKWSKKYGHHPQFKSELKKHKRKTSKRKISKRKVSKRRTSNRRG
uniref:Uncharacterized protein n=1 Tax=viral metagenome TaxID=1070528 RepID=A0A6M3J7V3_9ZZZZ